ncbi:MAG: hypothetical protein IJ438_10790 [Clostridia bacterium]|nr:hypothetical protein [Clostridia bacterium]
MNNVRIILLSLVIIVIVFKYLAECFYDVAKIKGHSDRKYFWICFIFGIFGYLLVIALPDRLSNKVKEETDDDTDKNTDFEFV